MEGLNKISTTKDVLEKVKTFTGIKTFLWQGVKTYLLLITMI